MSGKGKQILSGSALKWIAIVIMLVDHIGASLIENVIWNAYGTSPLGHVQLSFSFWWKLDRILRYTGRIAFPIFCFLLVEGALHTRDIKKYGLRLAAFSLLSELPFDLALYGKLNWQHQNVFFTLLLGLVAVYASLYIREPVKRSLLAMGAALAAELLHTDYGAFGVLLILLFFQLRKQPLPRFLAGTGVLLLMNRMEVTAALAFLPIALYSGERGHQPKYFFYAFYPVHLLVLWAVGQFLLPVLF